MQPKNSKEDGEQRGMKKEDRVNPSFYQEEEQDNQRYKKKSNRDWTEFNKEKTDNFRKKEEPLNTIDRLGEQFQNVIQDAVDSMDFSELSRNIQNAVSRTQEEILKQVQKQKEKVNEKSFSEKEKKSHRYSSDSRIRKPVMDRQPGDWKKRLPGRWSGSFASILGGSGLAIFGLLSLGFGLAGLGLAGVSGIVSTTVVVTESVFVPLTLLSSIFFIWGRKTEKRTKRIKEYDRAWKGQSYIMLEELAARTGYGLKVIRKDLHFLLEKQVFPQARLDEKQTCFMLTNEEGEQYDAAVKAREEREKEKQEEQIKVKKEEERKKELTPQERRLEELQASAGRYLEEIREKKEHITTPDVREKIAHLEMLLGRIFLCVKKYPDNLSEIDRLTEYYLPSVLKLIRVYEDMEKQPIQSANILKTRMEITESLSMVNQALETMYDDLFQDVALDISSDIKVLETMLAKDGWGGPSLHSSAKEGTSIWQ